MNLKISFDVVASY